jgi:hypothetical protein
MGRDTTALPLSTQGIRMPGWRDSDHEAFADQTHRRLSQDRFWL